MVCDGLVWVWPAWLWGLCPVLSHFLWGACRARVGDTQKCATDWCRPRIGIGVSTRRAAGGRNQVPAGGVVPAAVKGGRSKPATLSDARDGVCACHDLERMLTSQEVADVLRVPVGTLYQWRSRGVGPAAVEYGRYVMYRPSAVSAWVREREVA